MKKDLPNNLADLYSRTGFSIDVLHTRTPICTYICILMKEII